MPYFDPGQREQIAEIENVQVRQPFPRNVLNGECGWRRPHAAAAILTGNEQKSLCR